MSPAEKQAAAVARLLMIEDPQERLAALMSAGRKLAPLPEERRTDAHRVPGCSSRLWLHGELHAGRCRFQLDADSLLVKGLAAAVCELYQEVAPAEVMAHEPALLEELGLTSHLTPTRLHGLHQVRLAIKAFAGRVQGDGSLRA